MQRHSDFEPRPTIFSSALGQARQCGTCEFDVTSRLASIRSRGSTRMVHVYFDPLRRPLSYSSGALGIVPLLAWGFDLIHAAGGNCRVSVLSVTDEPNKVGPVQTDHSADPPGRKQSATNPASHRAAMHAETLGALKGRDEDRS